MRSKFVFRNPVAELAEAIMSLPLFRHCRRRTWSGDTTPVATFAESLGAIIVPTPLVPVMAATPDDVAGGINDETGGDEQPVDEGGGDGDQTDEEETDEEVIQVTVSDSSRSGYAFIGENNSTLNRDLSQHFLNADLDGYSLAEDTPGSISIKDGFLQVNPQSGDQGIFGSLTYNVFVTGTNSSGGRATAVFTIQVVNRPPTAVMPKSVELFAGSPNGTKSYDLKVGEPDGDEVTPTLSTSMPKGGFTVQLQQQTDADSGEVKWMLVTSGVASANQIGTHTATLTLDDGHGGKVTKTVPVNVKDADVEFKAIKQELDRINKDLSDSRASVTELGKEIPKAQAAIKAVSDRIDLLGKKGDQLQQDLIATRAQIAKQTATNISLEEANKQATQKLNEATDVEKNANAKVGPADTKLADAKKAAKSARDEERIAWKKWQDAPSKTTAQRTEKDRLKGAWQSKDATATARETDQATAQRERNAVVKAAADASKVTATAREAANKASKAYSDGKAESDRLVKQRNNQETGIRGLIDGQPKEKENLNFLIRNLALVQGQLNGQASAVNANANQLAKFDLLLSEFANNSSLDRDAVRVVKGTFADVAARPAKLTADIGQLTTSDSNLTQKAVAELDRIDVHVRRFTEALNAPPVLVR